MQTLQISIGCHMFATVPSLHGLSSTVLAALPCCNFLAHSLSKAINAEIDRIRRLSRTPRLVTCSIRSFAMTANAELV